MNGQGKHEGLGPLDTHIVTELKKSLRKLKPIMSDRRPPSTKQALLIALLPEIEAAKKRGYSNQQIIEHLKSKGQDISLPTLGLVLRKAQAKQFEEAIENLQ